MTTPKRRPIKEPIQVDFEESPITLVPTYADTKVLY